MYVAQRVQELGQSVDAVVAGCVPADANVVVGGDGVVVDTSVAVDDVLSQERWHLFRFRLR